MTVERRADPVEAAPIPAHVPLSELPPPAPEPWPRRWRARLLGEAGLSASLVACMALDFLLLESTWHAPLTAVQAALLVTAVLRGLRAELSTPDSTRQVIYQAALSAVAVGALVQKAWIVAQAPSSAHLTFAESYRVMGGALTFLGVLLVVGRSRRFTRYFVAFDEHPARQTALSFVALAIFGGFLLTLPICLRDPSRVAFVDALFMATSAVCVTGLAVHGVATTYTPWGQAALLGLVQVGGLGIMVLSASVAVLTGRRLRARSNVALAELLDAESVASLRGTIARIVGFTLVLEGTGAVLLYQAFQRYPEVARGPEVDLPMAGASSHLWAAIFHAVSAFCNAGFSLARDNLVPFVGAYEVCVPIMSLIVLGGIGFPVLSELSAYAVSVSRRVRPPRLSLHTRTSLVLTAALIAGAALVLYVFEAGTSLASLPLSARILAVLFQSVTLRTAGFNTVDIGALSDASLMVCCLFMFIGASPGGTGGGIKTTTVAVLFATFRAELRGAPEPVLRDRRLSEGTVRRAIAVAFVSALVVMVAVLALLLAERASAMRLIFEIVSAFGTVGLSANLSPSLTTTGKLIVILTMLIGRIGPLTVALAASERADRAHHRYPRERVLIG